VKIIEEAGNDTAAVTARVSARLTEMRQAIDDARGRR
jgi:hypothetical protein